MLFLLIDPVLLKCMISDSISLKRLMFVLASRYTMLFGSNTQHMMMFDSDSLDSTLAGSETWLHAYWFWNLIIHALLLYCANLWCLPLIHLKRVCLPLLPEDILFGSVSLKSMLMSFVSCKLMMYVSLRLNNVCLWFMCLP